MTDPLEKDETNGLKSEDFLIKIKKHRFVAVLIIVGTIFSGIAAFTESVDKVWNFISSRVLGPKAPQILEVTNPTDAAWTTKQLLDNSGFRIDSWDDERYSIALHINALYKNDKYNSLVYLRSIEGIRIKDSSGQNLVRSSQGNIQEDATTIRKTVILNFKEKPTKESLFKINVAKHYLDFKFNNLKWNEYNIDQDNNSPEWYGAQAQIELLVPDPDWPILRNARVLKGETSILELLIDNRSPSPVPISNVHIQASHPRSSGDSCLSGDPVQRVVLAWPASLEKQSESNSWTEIANQKVDVQTKFSMAGKCSGYSFRAKVPVANIIPPNSVSRLMLSLSELPEPTPKRSRRTSRFGFMDIPIPNVRMMEAVPKSIIEWSKFGVVLDPVNEIFPPTLPIE